MLPLTCYRPIFTICLKNNNGNSSSSRRRRGEFTFRGDALFN